jgi:hypothetical protein
VLEEVFPENAVNLSHGGFEGGGIHAVTFPARHLPAGEASAGERIQKLFNQAR